MLHCKLVLFMLRRLTYHVRLIGFYIILVLFHVIIVMIIPWFSEVLYLCSTGTYERRRDTCDYTELRRFLIIIGEY